MHNISLPRSRAAPQQPSVTIRTGVKLSQMGQFKAARPRGLFCWPRSAPNKLLVLLRRIKVGSPRPSLSPDAQPDPVAKGRNEHWEGHACENFTGDEQG